MAVKYDRELSKGGEAGWTGIMVIVILICSSFPILSLDLVRHVINAAR